MTEPPAMESTTRLPAPTAGPAIRVKIVTHAAPSPLCVRPVVEIRFAQPPPALPRVRWRSLIDALRAQPLIGERSNAHRSLRDDVNDFPAAAAIVAVCLQRSLDRHFDACFEDQRGVPGAPGSSWDFAAHGIANAAVAALDYVDPRLASRCAAAAVGLLGQASITHDDAARAIERLAQWQDDAGLRGTQREVALEARRRGLPVTCAPMKMPVLVLGHGTRQRWLWRTNTLATPHVAVVASTHKDLAHQLLRAAGLPVPEQQVVRTLAGARAAAERIGFPVVVKPASTDHGIAVTTSITDDATLATAFERARAHGTVLVEKHIAGDQHRLTVIGGKLATVARLVPAYVIGDGHRSIAELVERARIDRLAHPQLRDYPFPIDDETHRMLATSGMTIDSVPAAATVVLMRTNANLSGGGRIELIDRYHPDIALLAERAAATIGLDVAGIDLIATDVAASWTDSGAAICEINPNPGFVRGQASAASVLDHLMRDAGDGRIPIAAILGDAAESARIADRVAAKLRAVGHRVTVARDDRITIDGAIAGQPARVATGASPHAAGDPACAAVFDRLASAAVVVMSGARALADGFPFDRCALALVTASALRGVDPGDGARLVDALRASADQSACGDAIEAAIERWMPREP